MAIFKHKSKFKNKDSRPTKVQTGGQFLKCPGCGATLFVKEVEANLYVCPKCNYHMKMYSKQRLDTLFDAGDYKEFATDIYSPDPLDFYDRKDYKKRLREMREKTGLHDAIRCARGKMGGIDVIICAMEYKFIGGSMGSVVGEKITLAIEKALENEVPLIIISASGGARMMEGVLSLMQMAKISAALAKLDEAAIPYISVLTDPTTGGVTASFAMLGDLNIAEPGALIGFAGPRVIEQTIRQKLPEGFQRSEFLLHHGMLDMVVHRKDLKKVLIKSIQFLKS